MTTNTSIENPTLVATISNSKSNISQLFKRNAVHLPVKTEANVVEATMPQWAQTLIAEGDALVSLYQQYGVEVFDRSDAALWDLLQRIYQYVLSIDEDQVNSKLKKQEFVKHLKSKGHTKVSSSSSTASLVVKYVFGSLAKQTISNYTNTLIKAAGLKIPHDQFADRLKSYGGYAKFLEMYFDPEGNAVESMTVDQVNKSAIETRMKNVRRLFQAIGYGSGKDIDALEIVQDVVPIDQRNEEARAKDPSNSKYMRSNLVFFVAVEGGKKGTYKLAQGFSVNKQVEENLLTQFGRFIDADDSTLSSAVRAAEIELGIFHMEKNPPITKLMPPEVALV